MRPPSGVANCSRLSVFHPRPENLERWLGAVLADQIDPVIRNEHAGAKNRLDLQIASNRTHVIGLVLDFPDGEREPPRLREKYRQVLCGRGCPAAQVERYIAWCKDFVLYHQRRPPQEMGPKKGTRPGTWPVSK